MSRCSGDRAHELDYEDPLVVWTGHDVNGGSKFDDPCQLKH